MFFLPITSKFDFERLPLAARARPKSSKQATAVPKGHFLQKKSQLNKRFNACKMLQQ